MAVAGEVQHKLMHYLSDGKWLVLVIAYNKLRFVFQQRSSRNNTQAKGHNNVAVAKFDQSYSLVIWTTVKQSSQVFKRALASCDFHRAEGLFMKTVQSWFVMVVIVAACVFSTSKRAFADTYQEFILWSDNVSFYGMDNSGNVALNASAFCSTTCYDTFHDGVVTGLLVASPGLVVNDSGTLCTPAVPPGGSVIAGVCNNGKDSFTGFLEPISMQPRPGLYAGSFPDIATVHSPEFGGGGGGIFLNSLGDIVVDDVFTDDWYFFQNTSTVPEPSSIVLIATGALGLLEGMRRRISY